MKKRTMPEDDRLVYAALLGWDGPSLRPEWKKENQKRLTAALDRLRQGLYADFDEPFDLKELDTF